MMTWKARYRELCEAVKAIDVFLDAAMPDGTAAGDSKAHLRSLLRHEHRGPFMEWLNR